MTNTAACSIGVDCKSCLVLERKTLEPDVKLRRQVADIVVGNFGIAMADNTVHGIAVVADT